MVFHQYNIHRMLLKDSVEVVHCSCKNSKGTSLDLTVMLQRIRTDGHHVLHLVAMSPYLQFGLGFTTILTKVNLSKSTKTALFLKIVWKIFKYSKFLMAYIILAVQKVKTWKSSVCIEFVNQKLNWIMVSNKLTSFLHNSQKKSDKTLDLWIHYPL